MKKRSQRGNDLRRVRHMLHYAEKAHKAALGMKLEDFLANEILLEATAFRVQIIGEAAYRISKSFRTAFPKVPWTKIMRTRHRIVHDYDQINPQIVWKIATEHLPELIMQLTDILNDESE